MNIFQELFSYRQMLKSMVLSDLRTRYKGSILGFLWTFINPLLTLLVYTIVFSTIMRMNIEHYSVFMFIGLLPWINFSTSLLTSSGIIIRNSNLVKKIYFPHEILPLSNVIGGIINYLFGLVILCAAILLDGMTFSYHVVYFPVILLLQFILTLALSFIVSSVTVYFRDIEHILGALIMAWFYFTPIIYPESMIVEKYKFLFDLNPIRPIFISYQNIFYYHQEPNWNNLTICYGFSLVLLVIGWFIFRRLNRNIAEEL